MASDENLRVRIRQELPIVLVTRIFARLRIWASYVAMVCAGLVSFLFFRFPFNFARVRGRSNIPRRGEGVLFVSNHTTMYDSFLIGVAAYFPENIFYPSLPFMNFAARENFFGTWFSKTLFTLLRTVPVERRDHPWLMRKYVEFLESHNLLIFYQGTRSDDLSVIRKHSEKSIGWPNMTIGRRKRLRGSQRHSPLVFGPPLLKIRSRP